MLPKINKLVYAGRYSMLYFGIQSVLSMLLFVPVCLADTELSDYFYIEMTKIYDQNLPYFKTLIKTMPLISAIFSDFMYYITLFSGLIVTSFFLFRKARFKKVKFLISKKFIIFWLCVGILLNMTVSVVTDIFLRIYPKLQEYNAIITADNPQNTLFSLITIGIIAPVTEEIVFRYSIFSALKNTNKYLVIIYSSFIFAIMHINPVQVCYALILGALFGYLYCETQNLLIPVLLHISINSSSVISQTMKNPDYFLIMLAVCAIPPVLYYTLPDSKKVPGQ